RSADAALAAVRAARRGAHRVPDASGRAPRGRPGGGQRMNGLPARDADGAIVGGTALVKRFGGIAATDSVDFAIAQGDLVGLIGPNGSGKTTLINLLTGHLTPEGGDVVVRGRQMPARPPHEFAALAVARTFQLTQLFGRMTVLENMLVPGLTRPGSTRESATAQALKYLSFLNLIHLEGLAAKNLSGGHQKLLELGRALMLDPSVLFLDEPLAGVHPRLRCQAIKRVMHQH